MSGAIEVMPSMNELFRELHNINAQIEGISRKMNADRRASLGDARALAGNQVCRQLLHLSKSWLWETDVDHRISFISPQFSEYVNCDSSLFIGKTRAEVVSNSTVRDLEVQKHMEALKHKRAFFEYVYRVSLPDTGTFWFEVSGAPRFSIEDNKFLGYWGISRDRTKHKQQELEEIQKFNEMVHALDAMDVSILMLDAKHRISFRNERWISLHSGMPVKFLSVGIPFEDYFRAAVEAGMFPEALQGDTEEYIQNRLRKNALPPHEPFCVARQENIYLSIKISRLQNGSILIVSTEKGGK